MVARAAPRDKQRLDARCIALQCAQVFDGEDVVGLPQKIRRKAALLR